MVCVYGMSHVPALLLLSFPGLRGQERLPGVLPGVRGADLHAGAAPGWRASCSARPSRRTSAAASTGPAGRIGMAVASVVGALFSFITPFKFGQALAMSLIACVAGLDGPPGDEGAQARPRHSQLGPARRRRHRRQRPAGPRRCAVLRGADLLPFRPLVLRRHDAMRSSASTPACRPPASAWSTWTATRCATSPAAPSAPSTWRAASLPARLKVLFDGIGEIVERYKPDAAAVEIVFVNVNPQSTLLLGPGARRLPHRAGHQQPVGGRIHRAADEAGRRGPRQGGQGAGAGDGQAPAAAARPARQRRGRRAGHRDHPRARRQLDGAARAGGGARRSTSGMYRQGRTR